ncbi:Zinc/iron permease [Cytidiella melzeri]|nr:Zinc/iron permease [Cytidiella melzeri]
MSGFLSLLMMAGFLGLGSFLVGILPLSFTFSRFALAWLSSMGTGLLLGTALGVIIPEGVEIIANTNPSRTFPTTIVALSLVMGFSFMLMIEPVIHHRVSEPSGYSTLPLPMSDPSLADESSPADRNVVFDVELGDLERSEGATMAMRNKATVQPAIPSVAYPVTLGLMVHALADGFALGSSAFAPVNTSLSFVVFLALIVHKAPAVLALSTSLLATSLPRSECRKHVAVFSASTPIGALLSYGMLSLVHINSEGNWTGILMLISGGTFLYVATVLQPGKATSNDVNEHLRLMLVMSGMVIPVLIGVVVGHK